MTQFNSEDINSLEKIEDLLSDVLYNQIQKAISLANLNVNRDIAFKEVLETRNAIEKLSISVGDKTLRHIALNKLAIASDEIDRALDQISIL
ncbi:hypothetical protein RVS70_05340 [Virgibacillus sp. M23]|uniref:hypothetical protein n=1 Tax=Virgibacillus sp. M23 TaxID=3079030 RepID=UPI002A90C744|nr:hypothetical protein [Virgibacillus sp. M23]MDY7043625.1 hypothetical protein [Virgibacillus sp. M23]